MDEKRKCATTGEINQECEQQGVSENIIKMELIMAVDNQWGIGYQGDMLFRIEEDLQRFKEMTMGAILVMGRKTFESLPGRKPLPGRINVVVTKNKDYKEEGIEVVSDLDGLDQRLKELGAEKKKVFLIGGGTLIRLLLNRVDLAHITYVDQYFPNRDTEMPNLYQEGFQLISETEEKKDGESGLSYRYQTFERKVLS